MTPPRAEQADLIGFTVANDYTLYTLLCEYAADRPGDLAQAAADYCDEVLAPIFASGWRAAGRTGRVADRSTIRATLAAVLPTGQGPDVVEAIHELMVNATE